MLLISKPIPNGELRHDSIQHWGVGLQSKPTGPLAAGKVGFSNGSVNTFTVAAGTAQAIVVCLAQVHE